MGKSDPELLSFVMFVRMSHRYKGRNTIPIYLDVHPRWIDKIIFDNRYNTKYFVTSYDIYRMIKQKDDSDRCCYIPLFISDRYIVDNRPDYEKTIDIVQLGRKNMFLHNCAMKYTEEHANIEYVYLDAGGYISTKYGMIGDLKTRADYMGLLQRAKISLVSTPGSDLSKDFGGTDFFTPRFYESMASDCYLVGKYTENEEANVLSMSKYCPNIKNYDEFEFAINSALETKHEKIRQNYRDFLRENCSTSRAKYIQRQLKQ